jgi:1-acyl-sn-glycerol-3-phosphate acyltransferase
MGAWRDGFVFSPPGWRGVLGRTLYFLGYSLFRLSFKTLWRARALGQENVPPLGPLILAANHASFADPPLVGSLAGRALYFMGKEELFRVPLFGWLIGQVNCFPIRRKGNDVSALRTAQRILAAGGGLIVFPEGKRRKDGVLGRPKAGVGLLADLTKSAVVPVYAHNTHRASRLARLAVVYGPPLTFQPTETHEQFAHRVMDAIRTLKETHFGPHR